MDHEQWCQQKAFKHEDAARRIADTHNLHRLGGGYSSIGRWFAARLNDGTSDNVLYDDKRDAIVHQHHDEKYYAFICVNVGSMSACDAAVMLKISRAAYDNGMRLADPDHKRGGRDLIKRATVEDQLNQARGINSNLVMPWEAN